MISRRRGSGGSANDLIAESEQLRSVESSFIDSEVLDDPQDIRRYSVSGATSRTELTSANSGIFSHELHSKVDLQAHQDDGYKAKEDVGRRPLIGWVGDIISRKNDIPNNTSNRNTTSLDKSKPKNSIKSSNATSILPKNKPTSSSSTKTSHYSTVGTTSRDNFHHYTEPKVERKHLPEEKVAPESGSVTQKDMQYLLLGSLFSPSVVEADYCSDVPRLSSAHWDSLHLSNSKSSKEEKGEWTRQSSGGETVDVRVVMRRASGHARAEYVIHIRAYGKEHAVVVEANKMHTIIRRLGADRICGPGLRSVNYDNESFDADEGVSPATAVEAALRVALTWKSAWLQLSHDGIIPVEWLSFVATSV